MLIYCEYCKNKVNAVLSCTDVLRVVKQRKVFVPLYEARCPECDKFLEDDRINKYNQEYLEGLNDDVTKQEVQNVLRIYNLRPSQLARVLDIAHSVVRKRLIGEATMNKHANKFNEICYDPSKVREILLALNAEGSFSDHYLEETLPFVESQIEFVSQPRELLLMCFYAISNSEVMDCYRLNAIVWLTLVYYVLTNCRKLDDIPFSAIITGPVCNSILKYFNDWNCIMKQDYRFGLLSHLSGTLNQEMQDALGNVLLLTEDMSTDNLLKKLKQCPVCKQLLQNELPNATVPIDYELLQEFSSFKDYYSGL